MSKSLRIGILSGKESLLIHWCHYSLIGILCVSGIQLSWTGSESEASGLSDGGSDEVVLMICLIDVSSCDGFQTSTGGCWFSLILSPLPAPVPLPTPHPLPGKHFQEIVVMYLGLPQ